MRCPTCKQPVPHPVAEDRRRFRPFCSERCKLVDLGRWLDGSYAIPGEPADDDDLLDLAEDEPGSGSGERRRH